MADQDHLDLIKQGVDLWNKWRKDNPDVKEMNLIKANLDGVDLCGADLSYADLSEAKLNGANLSEANLSYAILEKASLLYAKLDGANLLGAKLDGASFSRANLNEASFVAADLRKADFSRANLSFADLSSANLKSAILIDANLSGAIVDESTLLITKKIKKPAQIGVNGIWTPGGFFVTDSAALMALTPAGNSMQGPNPEAVIESLKRARKLHGFSLTLVGIVILIAVLNLPEIKFPWAENVKVSPAQFGLLAMPMSLGLLALVISFMSDALKGARYAQDRKSAMSIGNFPWSLSKYAGEVWILKLLSCSTRLIMCLHPIVYIFILGIWQVFNLPILIILSILALVFSGWTLFISESFQKPLLFDRKTEEERKDSIEKQTEAIQVQTEKLTELIELLKPKEDDNSPKSVVK